MGESMDHADKPTKPQQIPRRVATLGVALIVLLSGAAGFAGGWLGSRADRENITPDVSKGQQIISSESELISQIAKDVGASVVSVSVKNQSTQRNFFGITPLEQESAGTGFIINSDGVIVTNRHVVPEGSGQVSITLSDGTELADIEVLGRTSSSDSLDVAFLKVKDKKGKEFKPVKLGDSGQMEVGDKVVAIGNALGQFQNTVTTGIISGYGRDVQASDETGANVETLQNLFQTDAAINQGNSGGPLVNINGEVIGINTAVAGEGAENVGFAIPINDIQGIIKSVLEQGKIVRPYVGVRYVSLTDNYAFEYNLSVKRGAYIAPTVDGQAAILPNSPAAKSGLKEKDIIIKVNGDAVDEKHSLTSLVGKHQVGEEITLRINRDGKEQDIKITLEAAPN